MSSSDLPKSGTEPTKIWQIFRKQSFQKISFVKVDLLIKYSLQKKEFRKIRLILDFESTNFANFEEVVHDFDRSDNYMI